MPAKAKYDQGRIQFRLDAESQAALDALVKLTGKKPSKILREALIEKARRDVPTGTKPE